MHNESARADGEGAMRVFAPEEGKCIPSKQAVSVGMGGFQESTGVLRSDPRDVDVAGRSAEKRGDPA